MSAPAELAACVAVVGPAQSGKTTLVNALDRALHAHAERPLAYVLQGSPDGTGRYLYEAPELRERLKPRVKGRWAPGTVETICRWIDNCRANLELVVVDFGGKHDPANARMLERCTHYVVVDRAVPRPTSEPDLGYGDMASWERVCQANGLVPSARVRTLIKRGRAEVRRDRDGVLRVTLRSDPSDPDDRTNSRVGAELALELVGLRRRRPAPYDLDLRLRERWKVEDLEDLAGLRTRLEPRARAGGPVVLGGVAPVWAFAAALHRALDVEPRVRVLVFDPKVAGGLVEVPAVVVKEPGGTLGRCLEIHWRRRRGGAGAILDAVITKADRFLEKSSGAELSRIPLPEGSPPAGPIALSGRLPIWLALTLSRWLRSSYPGRPLGHWDASTKQAVFVHGPGAPRAESWEA